LLKNNPDTLKIVFKNLPLRSHKMAKPAAEGAMAAHEQGRFWDFHDKIFSFITSPSKKKLNKSELGKIPTDLGLDMPRYLKSLKSPAIKKIINRDMREAQIAGVTGTPTLFVNGRRVNKRSPQAIQKMINQELQKLKGKATK
jgi:protein-disulfide isomerase